MSTDDGDGQALGILLAGNASDKGLGTDDVKGGDTKQALGVEDALGLENLGGDGDSGVDGVGDHEDVSVGSDLSSNLNETLHDASIDVEEIISSHTRLACCGENGQHGGVLGRGDWRPQSGVRTSGVGHPGFVRGEHTGNASRDDDDVGVLERGLSAIVGWKVACGLLEKELAISGVPEQRENLCVSGRTYGAGGDVRKIGSDTGGVDDIVKSQLIDVGRKLEEKRQRLEGGGEISFGRKNTKRSG